MATAARIAHAIPGRLRLRFEGDTRPDDGNDLSRSLGVLRTVPGVLATDLKLAARSAVVRYDLAVIGEAAVLAELKQSGIVVMGVRPSPTRERGGSQPSPTGRGSAADGKASSEPDKKGGDRSALMEALIGPPPKLDRRFVESLALSGVSLLAARQIGLAMGGGTTLPAYFVVWFALRRLTGAGRRRI